MEQNRGCGACTACCVTHLVRELSKRAGRVCRFKTHTGCRVYKKRPTSCAQFMCQWLMGHGDEDGRPDHMGVVIDYHEIPGLGMTVVLYEARRGVFEEAYGEGLKWHYLNQSHPVLERLLSCDERLFIPVLLSNQKPRFESSRRQIFIV